MFNKSMFSYLDNLSSELRFNERLSIRKQLTRDEIVYGTSFLYQRERSVLNPLRYIIGKTKQYRLDPKTVFIGNCDKIVGDVL